MLRNVFLLVILKGTFPHVIYSPWFMYIIYQATFVTNINIYPQNASYITESSRIFPSLFATNISYRFHISQNPTLPTQFSLHILSNVFDNFFPYYSCVSKSRFDLFCLPCYILNMYRIVSKPSTQHLLQSDLTVVT